MKTFYDVSKLVGELNKVAELGEMEFQVWNCEFVYERDQIPEHLLKIAKGNRFNKNKAVPAIRLKQRDNAADPTTMKMFLHMENQEAYHRLGKAIEAVKSSGLKGFTNTHNIIEKALKA